MIQNKPNEGSNFIFYYDDKITGNTNNGTNSNANNSIKSNYYQTAFLHYFRGNIYRKLIPYIQVERSNARMQSWIFFIFSC